MDVTPLVKQGSKIIQSYGANGFRISGEVYERAVIVTQDHVRLWDVPDAVEDFAAAHFDVLLSLSDEFDVVLLGTGAKLVFLQSALRNELKAKGLHVEVMDSGAASRTYNVLMAEGRRVCAALMIPA